MGFPSKNTGVGCLSYSRESSQWRERTLIPCVSCIGRQILDHSVPKHLVFARYYTKCFTFTIPFHSSSYYTSSSYFYSYWKGAEIKTEWSRVPKSTQIVRVRSRSWQFESRVFYLTVMLSQLFISYITELQCVYSKCILKPQEDGSWTLRTSQESRWLLGYHWSLRYRQK